MSDLVLGIDVGTSGVRAADRSGRAVVAFAASAMPPPFATVIISRRTPRSGPWARRCDDAPCLGCRPRAGACDSCRRHVGHACRVDDRGVPVTAVAFTMIGR